MKKISKYLMTVMIGVSVFAQNAFAAKESASGVCELISQLSPVIKTLRTLAFLGAALVLMDWAWKWISSGDLKKDDIKDKGIAMFVLGFVFFIFLIVFIIIFFI